MKKTKIIGLTAVALILVTLTAALGVFGITKISALIDSGKVPAIITNLAKKFNLNVSDVQQVFQDTRTQQQNDRLSQLVTDGKITEAQKQLIIDKRTEIESKVADINNKQMTATERADAIQTLRDDLKKWSSDNKIDERYVMLGGGIGGGINSEMPFGGRRGGPMMLR